MRDDAEIRRRREQLLLRQLFRAFQAMNVETIRRIQARGFEAMQPSFTRLLGNLDTGGTRVVGLARRLGVSRQAVSQLVAEIEARGFVQRDPDPRDDRGVIVRFTPKGRRALDDAIEVMTGLEEEYAARLGARTLASLKKGLGALLAEIDDTGDFGMD